MFLTVKKYGKIRGVTVEIRNPSDLEPVKFLMEIREGLK